MGEDVVILMRYTMGQHIHDAIDQLQIGIVPDDVLETDSGLWGDDRINLPADRIPAWYTRNPRQNTFEQETIWTLPTIPTMDSYLEIGYFDLIFGLDTIAVRYRLRWSIFVRDRTTQMPVVQAVIALMHWFQSSEAIFVGDFSNAFRVFFEWKSFDEILRIASRRDGRAVPQLQDIYHEEQDRTVIEQEYVDRQGRVRYRRNRWNPDEAPPEGWSYQLVPVIDGFWHLRLS